MKADWKATDPLSIEQWFQSMAKLENIVLISFASTLIVITLAISIFFYIRTSEKISVKDNYDDVLSQVVSSKSEEFENEDRYYKYMIKEIEREEGAASQRLTISMAFQGFITNAMAILLAFSWADLPLEVNVLRRSALLGVGILGLVVGIVSYRGINASRRALDEKKRGWERRNSQTGFIPRFAPWPYTRGVKPYRSGHSYATNIPLIFVLMWSFYIVLLTTFATFLWIMPCSTKPSVTACIVDFEPEADSPIVGENLEPFFLPFGGPR